jgi:hypothetical protein
MSGRLEKVTFKIAAAGTESTAQDLTSHRLVALKFPGTLVGTAFTFLGSVNDNKPSLQEAADPYTVVTDDSGGPLALATITAGDFVMLDPDQVNGLMWTKLVSGTAETTGALIIGVVEARGI